MLEYEKAFQPVMEKGASLNLVLAEDANLALSLNTLVEKGSIVGQTEMFSADVFYYLNPEKPNPEQQILNPNGTPHYATPQERLANRPPNTREGLRQIEAIMGVRPIRVIEPSRPVGWGQVATKSTSSGGWGR